jgi:GrpB-like predicted nucleotidyltransferase (UPF0157 family)
MKGIVVVEYDPSWPQLFRAAVSRLRDSLGDVALRIDHVGSTAVVGLDAKPIIDVQVSVASFEPLDAFKVPIERVGYIFRADNTERTKRYFREPPGERRTHIHVRRAGSFSEQFTILFREFLRTHPERADQYAALKHELADQSQHPKSGMRTSRRRHPSYGRRSTWLTTGLRRFAGSRHAPTHDRVMVVPSGRYLNPEIAAALEQLHAATESRRV